MTQGEKHSWLVGKLQASPAGRSLKELQQMWAEEQQAEKPLGRSTFNRWRNAVVMQFGLLIECDRKKGYKYSITNPEAAGGDTLAAWMLDTLATGRLLTPYRELWRRVVVQPAAPGGETLRALLDAMRLGRAVELSYRRFGCEAHRVVAEPYCVKFYDGRWYVLARRAEQGDMRIFALDRVEAIRPTAVRFRLPEGFDAREYFADHFGVVIDQTEPCRIVLRAYGDHIPYLRSLPLHPSQKEVARGVTDKGGSGGKGEEWAEFACFLAPTFDFVMQVLARGPMVEVREPAGFRSQVAERLAQARARYGEHPECVVS